SGERFGWTAHGTRSGSTINVKMKVEAPGLISELLGLVQKHVKATGTYTISPDGESITGGWRYDDGHASATERFGKQSSPKAPPSASGMAPSIGLVAAGKESHEEVVAAHVDASAADMIDLRVRKVAGAVDGAYVVVQAPANVALFYDAAAKQPLPAG